MKKIAIFSSLLVLVILTISYFTAQPMAQHAFSKANAKFTVIAHQGGNLERPDETLLALDHAVTVPSDILEFDIHLTKDHQLILMHDSLVDRTTNGKGAIADLTLAQLKQLNAAYWWPHHSPDTLQSRAVLDQAEFPYRQQNIKIASLKEVFDRYPSMPMLIEIKTKTPEATQIFGEMLGTYNRWGSTIVASFDEATLERFRKQYPQAATAASQTEVISFLLLSKLGLSALYSPSANALQVPMRAMGIEVVTKGFVAAAHQRGMQVHTWTLNSKEQMQLAIDRGVNGIITDRPQTLRSLLNNQ